MYRLGIDVGGTNTDAVIIDENNLEIINSIKVSTTKDIYSGILNAIEKVFENIDIDKSKIVKAMLGTTQCTNAIVERKKLSNVGIIRLGAPAAMAIKPMIDWPEDFEKYVYSVAIVNGGFEYDGKVLNELDEEKIKEFLKTLKGKVSSVAITGVFSSIRNEQEVRVRELVYDILGNIHTTISSEIGSLNLIERENACILNSMLHDVAINFSDGFEKALNDYGILNAKIYFSQNDGTLMSKENVKKYPILTLSCGPTNSIRGASYLSKLKNALIIDVGGTTTDIGVIVNEFPRESSLAVTIGGVKTNFRMPDIISVGLGGGSIVREIDGKVTVGPDSVGYDILNKAKIFGGDVITATDIAVRIGIVELGDKSKVMDIDEDFAKKAMEKIKQIFENAIDSMKTEKDDVDVVLVGGGSIICPDNLNGTNKVYKPNHSQVANAIGACISKVSGNSEKLISYDEYARDEAILITKNEAIENAINAGANSSTIEVVDIEDYPLQYQTNNTYKVKVKVAGDII